MSPFTLIDICDESGKVREPGLLARAENVHRQLRQRLPANYVERLQRVFGFGARMTVATEGEEVRGLAVWRCFEDTHDGVKFYVDDLVTDEPHRSRGVGRALIELLSERAKASGATHLVLDVGVQRHRSHAFCFREGFSIISHNFKKPLV